MKYLWCLWLAFAAIDITISASTDSRAAATVYGVAGGLFLALAATEWAEQHS